MTDADEIGRLGDRACAASGIAALSGATASYLGSTNPYTVGCGGVAATLLACCLALRVRERRARGLPALSADAVAICGAVVMIAMISVMLYLALRDPGGPAAQHLGR